MIICCLTKQSQIQKYNSNHLFCLHICSVYWAQWGQPLLQHKTMSWEAQLGLVDIFHKGSLRSGEKFQTIGSFPMGFSMELLRFPPAWWLCWKSECSKRIKQSCTSLVYQSQDIGKPKDRHVLDKSFPLLFLTFLLRSLRYSRLTYLLFEVLFNFSSLNLPLNCFTSQHSNNLL